MTRWVAFALVFLLLGSGAAPPVGAKGSAASQGSARSDGEVRQAVDKIMSHRQYRQLRRMVKEQRDEGTFFERCGGEKKPEEPKKVRKREGSGCEGCQGVASGLRGLMAVVAGLVVALVIGLIVWGIIKLTRKDDDEDEKEDEEGDLETDGLLLATPPGEQPASVYLQRALELADQGDYRGAVRQLLLGAMSWTERHGLIRYRRGLTNREYLRALLRHPTQREGMSKVVLEFEELYFGRREATAERFRRCLPGYRSGFEQDHEEAALAH